MEVRIPLYRICMIIRQSHMSLVKVLVAQLYPTLCDPMNRSPPGSSVHEILQARILEQVAIPFSRGSSQHRDRTLDSCISCIAGGFFITEPPGSQLKLESLKFCVFLCILCIFKHNAYHFILPQPLLPDLAFYHHQVLGALRQPLSYTTHFCIVIP